MATGAQKRTIGARGASLVEYGLLLFAIVLAAAVAVRRLGPAIRNGGDQASANLRSDGGGEGGGGDTIPVRASRASTEGGSAAAPAPAASPTFTERLAAAGGAAVDFGKGVVVDAIGGTIVGTYDLGVNLVTNPRETVTGIASGVSYAVQNPRETLNNVRQEITRQFEENPARASGNLVAQVVLAAVPVTKAGQVATGTRAANAAEAAGVAANARRVEQAAVAARRAEEADRAAQAGRVVAQADEVCAGGVCTRPGSCFAAGTPVVTVHGKKPIEQVAAGDLVLARDPETGATAVERVAQTFVREASDTVDLALEDESGRTEHLTVTSEHPFHLRGGDFRAVRDLAPGDLVDTATGTARVTALASLGRTILVFNFEVEHAHTYFVGETTAWVHNACTPPANGPFSRADVERLLDSSQGRRYPDTRFDPTRPDANRGHADRHVLPRGQRPADLDGRRDVPRDTVFRNQRDATSALQEVLNANADRIRAIPNDGRFVEIDARISQTRIYAAERGGPFNESVATEARLVVLRRPSGELQVVTFFPH